VCLVGAAFPRIPHTSCAQLAAECAALLEADADKDGLVSEQEWSGCTLWFQKPAFQPGGPMDLAAAVGAPDPTQPPQQQDAYDSTGELKKVLWDAFSGPAPEGSPAAGMPRLDVRSMLLYLCADPDLFSGIKKAFSVVAVSGSGVARLSGSQLAQVAYPGTTLVSGQDIERVPIKLEEIEQVTSMIWKSRSEGCTESTDDSSAPPSITAEQLMYGAHGERVVSHLLSRYQWVDLLAATKAALY
jgi:hypothetical protein